MDTIHIVAAANNRYAKPLAVMLTSLLENNISGHPISVYIIDGGLSGDNKSKLSKNVKRFKKAEVRFLQVDESMFGDAKVRYHLSKETYYRIAIPKLLSSDIKRAIYLDCDIIVKTDISKLWKRDLKGNYIGAVRIPGQRSRFEPLSIPEEHGYFNAGVLLIDLRKWREHDIVNKVLRFMKDHPDKLRFMDQDALNAVLHDKWLRLEPKWNYQINRRHLLNVTDPSIIHYTADKKPWNGNPPYKEDYLEYCRKTVWQE